MTRRRTFLTGLGGAGLLLAGCRRGSAGQAGGEAGAGTYPEKAPDLVLHTDRPPNLEMPLHYLRSDVTPNDAFFVRWHLADIPTSIDLRTFRLTVDGHVERPRSWSMDELRKLPQASVIAVNQCSGNARSLFSPRVTGVQWGQGALGNAKWTGVRLGELLERAGVKGGAACVSFAGLDKAPLDTVPAFVKSLGVAEAQREEVLVAYAMNDAPLPMLNGFPLRLVVPGYYSTYWVKALDRVRVLDQPFDGYWMTKAYRIPSSPLADEAPLDLAKDTIPISRLNVRSLVVRPAAGDQVRAGVPCVVEGIAFDGGSGIAEVLVSTDGGASWSPAKLDAELGKYSFRRWRTTWLPASPGRAVVASRATSVAGETQRALPGWNRAGYMRNVVEEVSVQVVA